MITNSANATERQSTALDQFANDYFYSSLPLNPLTATYLGLTEYDHLLTDFSPDATAQRADHTRQTLNALAKIPVVDETDRITKLALEERLGLEIEFHSAGETVGDLNVIASPLQELRDCFDLMPTSTEADWENVAKRLHAIPSAIANYQKALQHRQACGPQFPIRQVEACIDQALTAGDEEKSSFLSLIRPAIDNDQLPPALLASLSSGVAAARGAYRDLARFLASDIAPAAGSEDGVGRDRYKLHSRLFLGAEVDLEETYNWGAEILAETIAEQQKIAQELFGPGVSVPEAMERLNQDEKYALYGTDALQKWMYEKAHEALQNLNGRYFDIPEPLQKLDCKIASSGTGGIYYTGPSSDFSRPGAMWWSVPPQTERFSTWTELTTVYHEGVPGHHLQVGLATYQQKELNMFRSQGCWCSGHGEGWALYAERFMDELGYLADPAERMGMLDGQHLRAARVVLDIGVHLGLQMHDSYGSGRWDEPRAWEFLREHVAMDPAFLRFELDRYLGWPGQAPSYKVGQRIWEQLRAEAERNANAKGQTFDLRNWHMQALRLGSLPLSILQDAISSPANAL